VRIVIEKRKQENVLKDVRPAPNHKGVRTVNVLVTKVSVVSVIGDVVQKWMQCAKTVPNTANNTTSIVRKPTARR
jgi:hypothetical protein